MKFAIVFAALVACAMASGYQPGLKPVGNGFAAPYRNADRQQAVNRVAKYVGSGTGTAKYYGVPGADGYYGGYGYAGYAGPYNGGYAYGAPAYGYGAPGPYYGAGPYAGPFGY